MKTLVCTDPNHNTPFLMDLIITLPDHENLQWLISDLDLIPKPYDDYYGDGGARTEEVAYNFLIDMRKQFTTILTFDQLVKIFTDVRCIRNAVIICFSNDIMIDPDTFHPRVESKNPEIISHGDAICEIRILEGELFFIFTN